MKTTGFVFFMLLSFVSAFSQKEYVKGRIFLVNYPGNIPAGTEITFTSGTYRYTSAVGTDGSFQVPADCPDTATAFLSNETHVRNGVTMYDLARIHKHVVGSEFITDVLLLQAADVNNDRKVNSADLAVLRQVILGLTPRWPNGQTSWRFAKVPDSAPVSAQTNAYSYTMKDVRKIPALKFYGIKTGDVDGTAR